MLNGYLIWWYGKGFEVSAHVLIAVLYRLTDFFSLPILIRTWFSPWKNDVVRLQNASLETSYKIWQQNLASRIIGFAVRTVVILSALLLLSISVVIAAILEMLWLTMPLLVLLVPVLAVWVSL